MKTNQTVKVRDRKLSLRTVVSMVAVAILLTSLASYAAFSPATINVYLDDLPASATYTIKTDGTNYWAVRYDGYKAYESTNATQIAESVLNAVDGIGSIHFKAGVYDIVGLDISISYSVTDNTQQDLEIYGDGMFSTIFRGITTASGVVSSNLTETDQSAWFMIQSYDMTGIRVHLHDFQIDGQHDSQTNLVSGIVMRHPRDALIERVCVRRCSRNGISVVGANLAYRATTIQHCKIFDINDPDGTPSLPYTTYCNGINMEYGFADLYIYDNEIGWIGYVNDLIDSVGNGICISDSDIVARNVIWVVGKGIVTWWDVLDILIEDNWIDFAYDAGIHIDHANMTTCLNNVIRVPEEYGIYISNSSRCMVQNNKLLLRAGYSCVSFIWEANSADCNYNSISFNNAWNQGTISVECIHLSGANSTEDHNVGDSP